MLELNQIYNLDCLEGLSKLDNESVQLTFTSPPFSNMREYDVFQGISPDKYNDWIIPIIKQIDRVTRADGSFILNINDKVENRFRNTFVFELVVRICKETGFKLFERLFWNKGKYLPHPKRFGDKIEYLFWFVKSDQFYFDIESMRVPYDEKSKKRMLKPIKKRFNRDEQNQNTVEYKQWKENPNGALPSTLITIGSESQRLSDKHFSVFPLKLATYFIKGASKENDTILDPFMGSGTVAVAAKSLNRNYIGFDISNAYCEEANKRINKEKQLVI